MKKYTWLWDATRIISVDGRTDILKFCVKNKVNVIFLQWSDKVDYDTYALFIEKASFLGIEVHAAMGERQWYDPENYHHISDRLKRLQDYQDKALSPSWIFSGVHFDIEPHTLPEWKTDLDGVLNRWQLVIHQYSKQVETDLGGLELSAAVPIAVSKVTLWGMHMSEYMLYQHDKLIVMSYRDFAEGNDSITYHVTPFLEHANGQEKAESIVVAVETKDTSEGSKLTFAQEGTVHMKQVLKTVDYTYHDNKAYAGQAVHSLEHWMKLPPYM